MKKGFSFLFWVVLSITILLSAVGYGVWYNQKEKAESQRLDNLIDEQQKKVEELSNAINVISDNTSMKDYLAYLNNLTSDLYNNSLEIENELNKPTRRSGGGSIAPVAPLY
jgi:uncharacterized protein YlxW (UPF0749 family)